MVHLKTISGSIYSVDFVSFTIAGPGDSTVCTTDTFQVGGALNSVPTICGENANQHSKQITLF